MGDSRQFHRALDAGRTARLTAATVADAWFPGRRLRIFERQLAQFIDTLETVPQDEAAALTAADLTALSDIVNTVIREAEGVMARRTGSRHVSRNRAVVIEIYRLRSAVESLSRRVTADPAFVDVRWEEQTHPTPDR